MQSYFSANISDTFVELEKREDSASQTIYIVQAKNKHNAEISLVHCCVDDEWKVKGKN